MEKVMDFVRRIRGAVDALSHPAPADVEHSAGAGDSAADSYTIEPLGLSHDLIMFRLLVGIYQDKSFRAPGGFDPNRRPVTTTSGRPAPNMGIYTIVYDKEIKAKKSFARFSLLINFALGLQLIVAAALTAIGAAGGSRAAVTVFGAINTIVAGFLTFLKGSGLPNRYKYYQNEWGKVREYIEHRERDLALGRTDIDVHGEVATIRGMFEQVRQDIETNTPERFIGSNTSNKTAAPVGNGAYPQPHFGAGQNSVTQGGMTPNGMSQTGTQQHGATGSSMENKLKEAMKSGQAWLHNREKDEANVSETVHGSSPGVGQRFTQGMLDLKSQMQTKMHDLQTAEQQVYHEKQSAIQDKSNELNRIANEKIREVAAAEHDIQTHTVSTVSGTQDDARAEARRFMERALSPDHDKHDSTDHPIPPP